MENFFQSEIFNFLRVFYPIKIEMTECADLTLFFKKVIFRNDKAWACDACSDFKAACQPFNKLRFTAPKVSP